MASFHYHVKSGKKGSAAEHADYIARKGRHCHRDPVLWCGGGNFPAWSANNTLAYWKSADTYERENGLTYREHEIALPNELTLDQLHEVVNELIKKIAGPKTHQYAIHGPSSSIAGRRNTHMHLMVSERLHDGLPRSPKQTFARYNAKDPSQGGCKKDNCGRNKLEVRDELLATRKMVADVQNKALEKYGHDTRVDHRNLTAQGIKRKPEDHLGLKRVREMSAEEKAQHVEARDKAKS